MGLYLGGKFMSKVTLVKRSLAIHWKTSGNQWKPVEIHWNWPISMEYHWIPLETFVSSGIPVAFQWPPVDHQWKSHWNSAEM